LEGEQDVGLYAAAQTDRDHKVVAHLGRDCQDAFLQQRAMQLVAPVEFGRVMGTGYGLLFRSPPHGWLRIKMHTAACIIYFSGGEQPGG
jgi:hypothetical protein